ncbi:MAG: hypothetical protein Q8P79_02825 [Nanoarchaeota archaeon]|nr:hypothetical protein [Nanoarchaeota archaeon]
MRLEKMVEMIEGVAPSYTSVLEPVYKRVRLPIQISLKGFYPSPSRRKVLMGGFYEGINRALFGGKLNDIKFDIDFLNGDLSDRSIKPDIIDKEKNLEWESKSSYYDKECKIMSRQLEGYKFLQFSNPGRIYLFSFYRHALSKIEDQERTEDEVIKELLGSTLYSVILPLPVVLKMDEIHIIGKRKISRKHIQKEGTAYPDCLCINPSILNGFLAEPEQSLQLLGFDQERFEVKRRYYPGNITINRRRLKPFPVMRIFDKRYDEWIKEFRNSYEIEMERGGYGEEGISEEVPFAGETEDDDVPF